jgi:hypothetical protein
LSTSQAICFLRNGLHDLLCMIHLCLDGWVGTAPNNPLEYLASKNGMKNTYEFILFIIFIAAVMFPVTWLTFVDCPAIIAAREFCAIMTRFCVMAQAAVVELLTAVQLAELELFKADAEELSAEVELERHAPVLLAQIKLVEFASELLLAASIELLDAAIVELRHSAVLLAQIALAFAASIELLDDTIVELRHSAVLLAQIALEFAASIELLDDTIVELRHSAVLLAQIALEFAASIELLEDPVELERHAVPLAQIALEFTNDVLLHRLAVLFLICLQSYK